MHVRHDFNPTLDNGLSFRSVDVIQGKLDRFLTKCFDQGHKQEDPGSPDDVDSPDENVLQTKRKVRKLDQEEAMKKVT